MSAAEENQKVETLKDLAFASALAIQHDKDRPKPLIPGDVVAIRTDKYSYEFAGIDPESNEAVLRRPPKRELGETGDFFEIRAPYELVVNVEILEMGFLLNQDRMPVITGDIDPLMEE